MTNTPFNSPVTLLDGVPNTDVFKLHSNPTATKTIFLDFDGFSIASSPWENNGPLNLKGFYTNLNDPTNLTEIQRIWQRVAEDFAPFNVDVTTEDPGTEALRKVGTGTGEASSSGDTRWGIRVAFTSNINQLTGKPIKNAGGGGTAYYGSFNWSSDDVALVFNRGEYTAAETASHEVGHSLNLEHDGSVTGGEYYAGHGGSGVTSWASILGAGWLGTDEILTQWSKGEYFGSSNSEDDLAVINTGNGFTYSPDDHGDTFATATVLPGLSFSCFGVIGQNTEKDMFSFTTTAAGLSSFSFVNAVKAFINNGGTYTTRYLIARGPNLDISVKLYDSAETLLQTFNPADQITSVFTANLPAGTYFLEVDGVGLGNPLANPPVGYTDYGSLGGYMLTGTLQGTVTNPTPVVPPIVIDPNGAVLLLREPSNNRVFVRINGVDNPVKFSGSQITSNQFPDREVLAAETISGSNRVLWRVVSTGQIRTWTMDANWNFVTANPLYTPGSTEGLLLQSQFQVNAGGTPQTGTLPVVTLSVSPASVLENGAPNLIYTFNRTGDITGSLTVNFTVSGTAASVTDFASIGTSVNFAANSATATVTVDPVADTLIEANETVILTLAANASYTVGSPSTATGTITNDDAASFSVSDVTVVEGNSGTVSAVFTVTLNNAVSGGASVSYATANGTATAGTDYIATSGTLVFTGTAGEQRTVSVTVNGDISIEANETIFLNLSSPTNGVTIADGQGVGTITNDDASASTLQVIENNGTVELLRDTVTNRVSVRINGVLTTVKLSGSQITSNQFPDREILAAEVVSGVNRILWRVPSTGQIRTWQCNSLWNYVVNTTLVAPGSTAGLLLQSQFGITIP